MEAGQNMHSDDKPETLPKTPQTEAPSFRLGFEDDEFLRRDELRPVRLQLELLKPDLILEEHNIESTIVVFGSARLPGPEEAEETCCKAEEVARTLPPGKKRERAERRAQRLRERCRYYDEARKFARLVSEQSQSNAHRSYVIATGGGPGIMEAANRGATEADAATIGFNIALPREQVPNRYITPELCFQFHYFALRKMHFLMRAKALVIFPGGFGTLDELFETLTLIQTGKIVPMPVLLFGAEYWRRIVDFEAMADEGVIEESDLDIITYVDSAEEAWKLIDAFYKERDVPPPLMQSAPI
ncbi:MAG: LOG family protein [Parvibaculaceae bacterium]